jgi:hypothetical protein
MQLQVPQQQLCLVVVVVEVVVLLLMAAGLECWLVLQLQLLLLLPPAVGLPPSLPLLLVQPQEAQLLCHQQFSPMAPHNQ